MKTIKMKIYEYEELSQKAKDKVLSNFRDNSDSDILSDCLNESLKYLLEKKKIKELQGLKLYYSLNYCQGNGLCFIGEFDWKRYKVFIKHTSNYYHSNSTTIDLMNKKGDYVGETKDHEAFKKLYKEICKTLEDEGYNQIEYDNSEESIKETIDINEYMFYADGTIYNKGD